MSRADDNLHYVHRLRYTTQERIVGLFVIGAVLLLIASLAFSRHSSFLFAEKFTLLAYMRNAQGVSTDTRVKISGVEVGQVAGVDIAPDNRIEVTLRIQERFHDLVRADSIASLNTLSVFGNAAIEISSGDPRLPLLEDGATIKVEELPSLDELIARITPALESLVAATEQLGAISAGFEPQSVRKSFEDVAAISANLRDITGRVRAGEGAAGRLVSDEKLADDLAASVENLSAALALTEQRLRELDPVLDNTQMASRELPALLAESRELIAQLAVMVKALNAETGKLPDLVLRTRELMNQAQQTLEAVQNTWPISSSVPERAPEDIVPPQPPD